MRIPELRPLDIEDNMRVIDILQRQGQYRARCKGAMADFGVEYAQGNCRYPVHQEVDGTVVIDMASPLANTTQDNTRSLSPRATITKTGDLHINKAAVKAFSITEGAYVAEYDPASAHINLRRYSD